MTSQKNWKSNGMKGWIFLFVIAQLICSIRSDPTNGLSQVSAKDTRAIFELLTKQKKGWTFVRKEHKELLVLAITEFMSKENYPFIGRLIDA